MIAGRITLLQPAGIAEPAIVLAPVNDAGGVLAVEGSPMLGTGFAIKRYGVAEVVTGASVDRVPPPSQIDDGMRKTTSPLDGRTRTVFKADGRTTININAGALPKAKPIAPGSCNTSQDEQSVMRHQPAWAGTPQGVFLMTNLLLTGLLLAASAAPVGGVEHRTRVDHPTGAIDATYRGDVAISHKQVGAVGPAGRPSTLSCAWRADIAVSRDARHSSGSTFSRSIERRGVIEGRRPGWCSTQRAAISQEVARRSDELRGHVIQVAQEDHQALRAELDRSSGMPRTG